MSALVFERPDLPTFALTSGAWRVTVFDPRADGAALGARYVHGGYIAEVFHDGRCLTAAAKPAWDSYNGIGMPETFEESLGLNRAHDGEEFLRIGAGRVRKSDREPGHRSPLSATLNWTLTQNSPTALAMEVADGAIIDGKTFSYQLHRTLRLDPSGITSETRLKVRCPWSHTLCWYPHPFFASSACDKTAFHLPAPAHLPACHKLSDDGLFRLAPTCPTAIAATGVWGCRQPLNVHLDPAHGGGGIQMDPSYPLDKIVLWASPYVASLEPYWCRAWHDGEDAAWSISYRWLD